MILAKKSLVIIFQKKSLLILPFVSSLLILFLLLIVLMPLFKIEAQAWELQSISISQYFLFFGIILGFFFVAHFISLFFTLAITASIAGLVNNEHTSVWLGFKTGLKNFLAIALWALLMGTVGIVIRFLEYWVDSWATFKIAKKSLAELGWMKATFFVIPILAFETQNAITAITKSTMLVKETWGAPLISKMKISAIIFFARSASFIPLLITVLSGEKKIIMLGGIITTFLLISISILHSASQNCLATMLYLYASHNKKTLLYFSDDELQSAFQKKNPVKSPK